MSHYLYEHTLTRLALTMENLVKILKSLADLNRLRIVLKIEKKSLSVTEIIRATDLPQTLVSFHLRTLRKSGIVKAERSGPFIYYSLYSPKLIDILNDLAQTNDFITAMEGDQTEDIPKRKVKTK